MRGSNVEYHCAFAVRHMGLFLSPNRNTVSANAHCYVHETTTDVPYAGKTPMVAEHPRAERSRGVCEHNNLTAMQRADLHICL